MKWSIAILLVGSAVSFAPSAVAHDCTSDRCGDCTQGTHTHQNANGTLGCESTRNPIPASSGSTGILAVMIAGMVASTILVGRLRVR